MIIKNIKQFNHIPDEILKIASNNSKKMKSSIYLSSDINEIVNNIVERFNNISMENISKSDLLEISIREYIKGLPNKAIKEEKPENYMVIIFTSNNYQNKHYDGRFHGIRPHDEFIPKRWSAVSLSKKVIDLINNRQIRYLSLYRSGKGFQYCSEYAEIDRLEKITKENLACDDPTENDDDIDKYRIYIKGEIKKLEHKVMLGTAQASSLMRGKKTTLRKLLNASTIDEI
ncbi:hypothetical protein [Clostridium tyrobutyricum]|uniref:hypothetical protein n=1 Tax=Clostridium tyrobutyricum TaxID=1519 RepID=UPI0011C9DF1E|nr:hypothetical protein [Clostridium tyrobutyricum]